VFKRTKCSPGAIPLCGGARRVALGRRSTGGGAPYAGARLQGRARGRPWRAPRLLPAERTVLPVAASRSGPRNVTRLAPGVAACPPATPEGRAATGDAATRERNPGREAGSVYCLNQVSPLHTQGPGARRSYARRRFPLTIAPCACRTVNIPGAEPYRFDRRMGAATRLSLPAVAYSYRSATAGPGPVARGALMGVDPPMPARRRRADAGAGRPPRLVRWRGASGRAPLRAAPGAPHAFQRFVSRARYIRKRGAAVP
jgi:hypothetical protein